MRMKSVNIKKQASFCKDMLVFNIKQVNLYDFWINSKYDFSRMKSVNIKKKVRFGKDMLVFNIKQVNLYEFWINSDYE